MRVTLIISVYNKIRELELVFHALERQSVSDFDVVLADDGSGNEMTEFLEKAKHEFSFPMLRIWQDNKGFRKNRILNKALTAADTNYLIFIDGDCIPNSIFIESHINQSKAGSVLCGKRIQLGKKFSEALTKENIIRGEYEKRLFRLLMDSVNKNETSTKHPEQSYVIKNQFIRNKFNTSKISMLGCNFSVEKELLLSINGFDENYAGPGLGEDSDIEFRLRLRGIKFETVRNLANVYHIYHTKTIEDKTNFEYFTKVKEGKKFFCDNGLLKTKYNN